MRAIRFLEKDIFDFKIDFHQMVVVMV